jgi:plasmid stabilization system protein ParE
MDSKYNLSYGDDFADDLRSAFEYYAELQQDLADDFLKEAKIAINSILTGPLHFQKVFLELRKVNLHRFPYAVFYIVTDDVIVVVAIMHLRRHPNVWQTRK